jgi:hypothetical protein
MIPVDFLRKKLDGIFIWNVLDHDGGSGIEGDVACNDQKVIRLVLDFLVGILNVLTVVSVRVVVGVGIDCACKTLVLFVVGVLVISPNIIILVFIFRALA